MVTDMGLAWQGEQRALRLSQRRGGSVGNDTAPTVYQISLRSNKALMSYLIHTHLKDVSVWFWKLMQ